MTLAADGAHQSASSEAHHDAQARLFAVKAVFCDGGLIGRNPSEIGGTWAACAVTSDGEHVRELWGYLLTKSVQVDGWPRVKSDVVTNNDSEFYAAMRVLEVMPDRWSGVLASDSEVTLGRIQKIRDGGRLTAFRADWESRLRSALVRLGEIKLVHLAGHPTLAQEAEGIKTQKDGTQVRVNTHQVWADRMCKRLAETWESNVHGAWDQPGLITEGL